MWIDVFCNVITHTVITMAKRGRKPKLRKGYFYENEEQAVIDYITTNDKDAKNEIFNKFLYPAFVKMIESIIRRYNLYCSEEEFQQTFEDTLSYLMSKISHYKHTVYEYTEIEFIPEDVSDEVIMIGEEEMKPFFKSANENSPKYIIVDYYESKMIPYKLEFKKYKAFSYCQTIVRNYLLYKRMQVVQQQQRNTPYDSVSENFENNEEFSTNVIPSYVFAERLINKTKQKIRKMVENPDFYNLSEKEVKVGYALCDLFDDNKWETLIKEDDSNKLLKSSILYFLREETLMTTKELRDNMRNFMKVYYSLKEKEIEEGIDGEII